MGHVGIIVEDVRIWMAYGGIPMQYVEHVGKWMECVGISMEYLGILMEYVRKQMEAVAMWMEKIGISIVIGYFHG